MQTSGTQASGYDEVPYSVGSFPQTHPDQLATIATLFGMNPPNPDHCRVLELGCAAGGNVIPMGLSTPESQFIGIDFSSRQIAQGLQTIKELNISNVQLRHLDILDFPNDLGQFDFILAHGVYSWVPPPVQRKILDICNRNLSPGGVAYVSYNTYPGWHARGALREMILFHTRKFTDPAERISQARTLLLFLAMAEGNRESAYGSLLREELALLLRVPDNYLFHEHLEDSNEPVYFHQFAERAAENGLQYLAEAQISIMMPKRFGAETERLLLKISSDLLHIEQNMDFITNRMFRQTLLCHADVALKRELDANVVKQFRVASAARNTDKNPDFFSGKEEEFRLGKSATMVTRDPMVKAAMAILAAIYPASTPFDELYHQAREKLMQSPEFARQKSANIVISDVDQFAASFLNCYTSGFAEMSLTRPKFTVQISQKPLAGRYVRLCADRGTKITNVRMETSIIGEMPQMLLLHLDGRHDRAMLIDLAEKWMKEKSSPRPREELRKYVDEVLDSFASSAMLIG